MKARQASSQRLNEPPAFLREAIERLRLVPPDFDLEPLDEALACLQNWLLSQRAPKGATKSERAHRADLTVRGEIFDSAPPEVLNAKETAESVLNRLPEEFRDSLISRHEGASEAHKLLQTIIDFENFRSIRKTLRWIVANKDLAAQSARFRLEATIIVPAWISVNAQGELDVNLHSFFRALEGIEVARIRECKNPRCQQIFWAGRADKLGCSPACQQAIRDHRWRENYLSKYKLQRLNKSDKQTPRTNDSILRNRKRKGR